MRIGQRYFLRSLFWQWTPVIGKNVRIGNMICYCHLHIGYLLICTKLWEF